MKTPRPVQCFRCQKFNHVAVNCHVELKCMKCSGDHMSKFCTLIREEPNKCPNCGGNHVANYRGCTYFKNNIKPTFKRIFCNKNTQDPEPQQQQPLNINAKFPTLPNSKNNPPPFPTNKSTIK